MLQTHLVLPNATASMQVFFSTSTSSGYQPILSKFPWYPLPDFTAVPRQGCHHFCPDA